MRTALAIGVVCALVGCGGDDPPPTVGRGPFRGPPATTRPAAAAPLAGPGATGRREYGTTDHTTLHAAPPVTGGSTTTTSVTPAATTAEEAHRDLPADLAAAIGSPASCIDTTVARGLHGRLLVNVSATVTAVGTVTRATASGTGLPESTIECIRARALAAHLAGPVEGAPRTISTTLAFDITTTDDETTTETPVWHQPGAVAEPGHVLPAGGTVTARPEGSVRPDSVLPAVAPSGAHQEGRVAPDIVLPARGQ
jgi:hypothetical protein